MNYSELQYPTRQEMRLEIERLGKVLDYTEKAENELVSIVNQLKLNIIDLERDAVRACDRYVAAEAEVERLKTLVQHWESKVRDQIARERP